MIIRGLFTPKRTCVIIGCNECGLWKISTGSKQSHTQDSSKNCPDCAIRRSHENKNPESYFRDMEWRKLSQEEFKTRINLIFGGQTKNF